MLGFTGGSARAGVMISKGSRMRFICHEAIGYFENPPSFFYRKIGMRDRAQLRSNPHLLVVENAADLSNGILGEESCCWSVKNRK